MIAESGLWGYANAPVNSQPDELPVVTSGGGSVTFNGFGAVLEPGTTSGDLAQVGSNHFTGDRDDAYEPVFEVVFSLSVATPTADSFAFGYGDGKSNINIGFNTDDETAYGSGLSGDTLSGSLAANIPVYLRLAMKADSGDTPHFDIYQAGGANNTEVSETLEFGTNNAYPAGNPLEGQPLAEGTSNGNGEVARVHAYRVRHNTRSVRGRVTQ